MLLENIALSETGRGPAHKSGNIQNHWASQMVLDYHHG